MSYYDWGWKPYVSKAKRERDAQQEVVKRQKKGEKVSPVVIDGTKIAKTFWGKAWCDNLERYSDYENRLPRGRSYVRNGSVIDLKIEPGVVKALVSGSSIYEVKLTIKPVAQARWDAICKDCAGGIDSLVELLQGKLSDSVMKRICADKTGLFPAPAEIDLDCDCPDWAGMCKHIAAVMYGVGARLDHRPELLFLLRGVDEKALIAGAGAGVPLGGATLASGKVLGGEDLADIFGLDMGGEAVAQAAPAKKAVKTKAVAEKAVLKKAVLKKAVLKKAIKKKAAKKASTKTK